VRVLLLACASPDPARTGQRLRYRQHIIGLASAGAEVGIVTYLRDSADEIGLARLASSVSLAVGVPGGNRSAIGTLRAFLFGEPVHLAPYRTDGFESSVRTAVRSFSPDAVIAGSCYLAPYLDGLPPEVLRVVDEHNDEVEVWEIEAASHSSMLRRRFASRNGKSLRKFEPDLVRAAQLTLAVSSSDQARFEARGRNPVEVIPNAVESDRYSPPADSRRDPGEVLFTGTDAARNLEALEWLAFQIWPRILREAPHARLTIAGSFSPASRRPFRRVPRMIFTGRVPDILPYFHRASVFVAPFSLGGGTRLKILEAGAAGLAVVSTDAGVRGLDLQPGTDFLRADTAESIAGEVVRLLLVPAKRNDRSAALLQVVRNRYDTKEIGRRLFACLEKHRQRRG